MVRIEKMKCVECGAFGSVSIISDSATEVEVECGCCGRSSKIGKISIGRKEFGFYINVVRDKVLSNTHVYVEARGNLIPIMLQIVGKVVEEDRIAQIEDVSVSYHSDDDKRLVPTERVLLKRR